ncbi:MAG: universal stress protein [Anaerolineaceae bacterium]
MFSKILIPLDGTPECEAALVPAIELAKKFDSAVVLLSVTAGYGTILGATAAESFGSSGSVAAAAAVAEANEEVAAVYLQGVLQSHGTPAWETVLAEGNSAEEIVEQARKVGADLIVMATHARSGLKRLFIGSVSEDVIRKCGIPVLVVHTDDEADD